MKKILLLLMITLLIPQLSPASQGEREVRIRQAPVPASPPYQGEVRLLRRDSAAVVQTVLNSKVMNRVVGAIQKKELGSWPEQREGSADSRRYLEELAQAWDLIQERARERQKSGDRDRYLQLLIEFVLEGERGYVALYAPTLSREDEHLVVQKKELLKKVPLSGNYLQKNMQLIIQDCFGVDAREAGQLLQTARGGA